MEEKLNIIIEKLDRILNAQELQARMTVDLIQQLDDRRFDADRRRQALDGYANSIANMMKGSGAPPELVENFKQLFNRSFTQ
jgi:hypothetical protein